jgi:hypothetical protein
MDLDYFLMLNPKMTYVLNKNQFLAIGSCFNDLKWGVFAVFLFGKTDTQLSEHF